MKKTKLILWLLAFLLVNTSLFSQYEGTLATITEDAENPFTSNVDSLGVSNGIAVTAIPEEGGWSFYDGTTWWDFRRILSEGPVSPSNALLLPANTPIRYSPPRDFNGVASFSYRTWSQSSGTSYFSGDASAGGAFGSTDYQVDITVTPVNDAPKLTGDKQVLRFDGANDYVSFPSTTFGGEKSFETWFYVIDPTQTWIRLFEFAGPGQDNTGNNLALGFFANTGRLRYLSETNVNISPTTVIQPLKWSHVAIVHSNSRVKIYLNGQEIMDDASNGGVQNSTRSNMYLAKSNFPQDNFFGGDMRHFRVWNRLLSPEEIQQSYGGIDITGDGADLLANFPLEGDLLNRATHPNKFGDATLNDGASFGIDFGPPAPVTRYANETVPLSGMIIQDVDGDTAIINLSIPSSAGILTIEPNTTLLITGNESAALSLRGKISDINMALNSLIMTPTLNLVGEVIMSYTINDLGFTGQGDSLTDSGTRLITLLPIDITMIDAPTTLCSRSVAEIAYSTNVTLNAGNVLTVQLSNASGNFASPVVIGTLSSTLSTGSITVTIPDNFPDGTGYRMRIVSSNTAFIGTDNGQDILVGDYCPAGLGIVPALWLRADRGVNSVSGSVSTWEDQSGRGNNHVQATANLQPGYETNTANFNPTLTFNGSQYVEDADGFLDYATDYNSTTLFIAHNSATPHSNRGLYGQVVTLNPGNTTGRFMGHGEFFGTQYFGVKGDSGNDWVQLPSGSERMNAYVLNTFSVGNQVQNLWFNGGDNYNTPLGFNSFKPLSGKPWVVGVAPSGVDNSTAFYQKGNIAELLVFYQDLSTNNRIKLETYMGIKYGINLLHNYMASGFDGNNAGTTTVYDISSYGSNVAGIARDDEYRLYQKQSRSMNSVPYAGMVTMGLSTIAESNADNTGSITDGLYIVWGDNGVSPAETTIPGTSLKKLTRSWKVQTTGQPSSPAAKPSLQVSLNLTEVSISSSDYTCLKLLIDRDGDGNLATGVVEEYTADESSTVSAVVFNNIVWDTDNSGTDVFFLVTNCCAYPTAGGTIAGTQSICPNTTAAALTSSTEASGHVGELQYRWQRSTLSSTAGFTDIANSNSVGYSPGMVSQTTWYRRLASVDCFEDWEGAAISNVIQVTAMDTIPPTIACTNTTIRFNGEGTIPIPVSDVVSATDNCGVASIVLTPSQISCEQLGQVVPVQIVVTDVNGNTSACMVQVTVNGLPCGWRHNSGSVGSCTSDIDFNPLTGHWPSNATNCRYGSPFTNDKLMFAQYQLCGDGSITAQVIGLDGAQPFAGITMRENNDEGSKKVQLMINRISNILRREVRNITGAQCFPTEFPSPCERTWLRLVRTGNIFRGYTSQDGLTWWYVMQVHVPMNSCIEIGLVLTNMQNNLQSNGSFANVSVTGGQQGPVVMGSGMEQSLDEDALLDVIVYPNPAASEIHVELSQNTGKPVHMDLYDARGQIVWNQSWLEGISTSVKLTLDYLPTGVYTLRVKSPGMPDAIKRIIIQR